MSCIWTPGCGGGDDFSTISSSNKSAFMGSSSAQSDLEIQVDGMNRPGSDPDVVVDAYSELETRLVTFCFGGTCHWLD